MHYIALNGNDIVITNQWQNLWNYWIDEKCEIYTEMQWTFDVNDN